MNETKTIVSEEMGRLFLTRMGERRSLTDMKKWVDALRSGRFKQDKGQLKSDKGHCCLGVFCAISGLQPYRNYLGSWIYNGMEYNIPSSLGGVEISCNGHIVNGHIEMKKSGEGIKNPDSLAQLNDEGFSFEEIAEVIEFFWEEPTIEDNE